jgi:hypothetical protein
MAAFYPHLKERLTPSSITKCNTEENRVSFVYEKNI